MKFIVLLVHCFREESSHGARLDTPGGIKNIPLFAFHLADDLGI